MYPNIFHYLPLTMVESVLPPWRFATEKFGRFRILVIGRANAGKTTLLKQICNSKENPEIYDEEGKKVNTRFTINPRCHHLTCPKRGEHNIENKMVFRSNPGFVFHDSRGFEAGSVDEFNKMKDFVTERAKTRFLKKRVHAIWYCIPMDQIHRAILTAEEKFFDECETGNAEDKRLSEQERLAKVKKLEESMLKNSTIWERLQKRKNPPKVYAEVKGLYEVGICRSPMKAAGLC
ncbi:hypothetical protein JVU11DRAFT_11608 [Chiua virens]|nr:hypothetical protein JVU11DRAFT_11608 [Chiua virens]